MMGEATADAVKSSQGPQVGGLWAEGWRANQVSQALELD